MLHEKLENAVLDAPFAKKREDINDGDMVKILSSAEKQPDRFTPGKMQTVIKILTKNGPRYTSINQTSINALINTFGSNNDEDWIGREAKVLIKPAIIGGRKTLVSYLVGEAWELDEFGAPFNPEAGQAPIPIVKGEIAGEPYEDTGIPEEPDEEEVKVEDVPF